jgi:hypothetical protein
MFRLTGYRTTESYPDLGIMGWRPRKPEEATGSRSSAGCCGPCGFRKAYVTQCNLGIFADQAAEPVSVQNSHAGDFRRRTRTPDGRVLQQRPVGPMLVVVIGALAQDQSQVPLTCD